MIPHYTFEEGMAFDLSYTLGAQSLLWIAYHEQSYQVLSLVTYFPFKYERREFDVVKHSLPIVVIVGRSSL